MIKKSMKQQIQEKETEERIWVDDSTKAALATHLSMSR
jgi:hypothetical protein